MIQWWQHLPENIDPIAFTVGFFSVHWYALCWLGGFFGAFIVAVRLRRTMCPSLTRENIEDLFLILFLGAFIGGHLGYAVLYRPDLLLTHPAGFFLPFQEGEWQGLSGMSFHGGLIGVVLALMVFIRRHKFDFFLVADMVALVAPVALFFGRVGNFLAGELYGRTTDLPWGMIFPGAPGIDTLRHPSALYEALGEGGVLFGILMLFRTRFAMLPGMLSVWFLIGYGGIRFTLEWVREPDPGVGLFFGMLTRGQVLSLGMIVGGLVFLWLLRKKHGKIGK